MTELNEPILPDDYPMHGGYLYVIDGKVRMNEWMRHSVFNRPLTVAEYRMKEGVAEIRRCDIVGREQRNKSTEVIPQMKLGQSKPNRSKPKKRSYRIKKVSQQ